MCLSEKMSRFNDFLRGKKKDFEAVLAEKFKDFDPSPFKIQNINYRGDEFVSPGYRIPLQTEMIMLYKHEGMRIMEVGKTLGFSDIIRPGCGVNSFALMTILDEEKSVTAIDAAIVMLSSACRRTYDVHCREVWKMAPSDAKLILVVRLLHKCEVWEHHETIGIGLSVYSRFLPIWKVK